MPPNYAEIFQRKPVKSADVWGCFPAIWLALSEYFKFFNLETSLMLLHTSQVLTLASNERVPLTSSMRLVFEISHLQTATPATVSRAGILYINQQDLGWNPWVTHFAVAEYQELKCLSVIQVFVLSRYVASWIDQREHQTERAHLTILFEKYVPRCVEQMRNTFKTIVPIPENSMVQVPNKKTKHPPSIYLLFCLISKSPRLCSSSCLDPLRFARLPFDGRKHSIRRATWALWDLLHLRLYLGLWRRSASRSGMCCSCK